MSSALLVSWGGTAHPGLFPQEVIVPEGKWRKVSPTSLSLSLPDADYQCIHRTSVSSLSAKESSFTSEEPLVSGEGCVQLRDVGLCPAPHVVLGVNLCKYVFIHPLCWWRRFLPR